MNRSAIVAFYAPRLESMPEPALVMDQGGDVLYANRTLREMGNTPAGALAPGDLALQATATVLPASGVTGADIEAVKFTQVLRGYKTSEVDWVLDRLGAELDQLRGELAAVRSAAGLDEPAVTHHAAPTIDEEPV